MVLRHLVCKHLINSILKNIDRLRKRIVKESRFPISSSCTEDDAEPIKWFFRSLAAAETGYTTRVFEEDGMLYWQVIAQERHEGRWYAYQRTHLAGIANHAV